MFLCPELIETILSLQKTLHGIVLACYKSRNQLVRLSLLVRTVLEKKGIVKIIRNIKKWTLELYLLTHLNTSPSWKIQVV